MGTGEWILCCALVLALALFLYYIFKENTDEDDTIVNNHSIQYYCTEIKKIMNGIINMDIEALRLNKKDLDSRRELKRSLGDAIRKCAQGNICEKTIVTTKIKSSLMGVLKINEDLINEAIPFERPELLTSTDMFEIIMYLQKKHGNYNMFQEICRHTDLDRLKTDTRGCYYDITDEDIQKAFQRLNQLLSYDDKLNILTQRIYEETYGLSVVDLLIMEDTSIDCISGGISGITTDEYIYREEDSFADFNRRTKTYESVYIVFSGKTIHMKFLSFGSNAGIVRVCKNLTEHGRMGHFTSSEGGIKTHLSDGSRVTVFRPNNASQWAFFVRKFGSTSKYELKDLIIDKGCEYPLSIIKWAIKGCANIVFSGDQNSGKTTNMRAAVREIDRRQQIRTIEADFELYLNDSYTDMNILGTRPSSGLPFSKLIELLKASEAHTILFGETASLEHAKYLIDLLLAGTKRIITTGHWPTSDELISYFILAQGGYGNTGTEDIERMVVRLINLDVHHVKDNDGHRYIDRITEIIPFDRERKEAAIGTGIEGKLDKISGSLEQMTRSKSYYTRDIVVYKAGEYHMMNPISKELSDIIIKNLSSEEISSFLEFNHFAKEVSRRHGDYCFPKPLYQNKLHG